VRRVGPDGVRGSCERRRAFWRHRQLHDLGLSANPGHGGVADPETACQCRPLLAGAHRGEDLAANLLRQRFAQGLAGAFILELFRRRCLSSRREKGGWHPSFVITGFLEHTTKLGAERAVLSQ
jgi:hypothetical protein